MLGSSRFTSELGGGGADFSYSLDLYYLYTDAASLALGPGEATNQAWINPDSMLDGEGHYGAPDFVEFAGGQYEFDAGVYEIGTGLEIIGPPGAKVGWTPFNIYTGLGGYLPSDGYDLVIPADGALLIYTVRWATIPETGISYGGSLSSYVDDITVDYCELGIGLKARL